jgi:CO/xanthine dehydrogenase Mo-binding subunit
MMMDTPEIVGKSFPRHESIAKVTGHAQYTDDLQIPGMVYGRILRSPYAHARIRQINKSEAEKVPGVLGILLPQDVPNRLFNCSGNPPSPMLIKDERVLTDHPLYAGDRIAAVAALSNEACTEAVNKILVEYEPLPAVFEIEEALREKAPLIHPELFGSNIFKKLESSQGDVGRGFAESDYIFEDEFYTPAVQHVAMEPVSCICHYTEDEQLTVWSTSQTPFQERRVLGELLDLPENKVRVIKPVMGGGFGGRQQIHNQHVGAFLSRLIRRPVKIINTREEEMVASVVRHGSVCRVKFGVRKDGRLVAFHAKVYLNAGPYCTHTPIVLGAQSRKFQYRIPHYRYEGYGVYTNGPIGGAMRGYGNPQLTFAREVMMDRIAKKLGIDPLQFRVMNHLETGETIPCHTFPLRSCAITECVEMGERIRNEIERREAPLHQEADRSEAWGVAFACHTSGPSNNEGMSSSLILVNDDGTANLLVGSADIGQGCETTLSQIAAQELGMDLKDITVTSGDTFFAPYDTGTFASSQIYVAGNAVRRAAQEVKEKLCMALATSYQTDPERVCYEQGHFMIETGEDKKISLSFKEGVAKVMFGRKGGVLTGFSSFKAEESPLPFSVCWAKVAVDKRARTFSVRHIIQVVDVGTPVNPEVVKGQVEGGISMGLGYALMEQIEIDPRAQKPSSSDLLHYKVSTTLDMPDIHVAMARRSYEPTGPFGAKSVGELPAVAVAPAIVNAISIATGEKINSLPLSKAFTPQGRPPIKKESP